MRTSIKDSIINYLVLVMIIHGCTKHSSQGSQTIRYGEMKLIPGGTFEMGGNDPQASADEFPRHMVTVDSFYIDIHEVTNGQFAKFVASTNYVTIAEKNINWEEMKINLPAGTPKPAENILQAGSVVFRATNGPVSLNDEKTYIKFNQICPISFEYVHRVTNNIFQKQDNEIRI